MTLKEKAKAYDIIIEKAYKMRHENCEACQMCIEELIPELKESEDEESEDERIRKGIIRNLEYLADRAEGFVKNEIKERIAWLEKQKEFVSADFDDVWETADCEELIAPLEKYSKDAIKKMCHAWYDKGIELERRKWLKKQGWQNNSDVKDYNSIDPHFGKPIDKVEPKFHEAALSQ